MAKNKSKKRKRSALSKLLMRNVRRMHREGLFINCWDMKQIEDGGGWDASPPNSPDTRPSMTRVAKVRERR